MDWNLAITRNRKDLLHLLAMLFTTVGLVVGGTVEALPRRVYCAVLRVLISVESAARRLVVIEARNVSLPPSASRPKSDFKQLPKGTGTRGLTFPLLDPRKRVGCTAPRRHPKFEPRISMFGFSDPIFGNTPVPSPEDLIGAARICQRLLLLRAVLDDLPRQAKRLVRLQARREASPGLRALSPLRPGRPPGHRARRTHPVDGVLEECEALARRALVPPDT